MPRNPMRLTADKIARAWGDDALVRLPTALATAPIPSDAREFLVQAGLPALVRYFGGSTEVKATFCRLAMGLSPVLGEKTGGPPLPPEWSVYWILGDEFFCNGSAWWCIHEQTGHVNRIDIELNQPIKFANSSVAHFASAVLAASSWSDRCSRSAENWPSEVDRLKRELADLDSSSMESDRNYWPVYLDFIRDEDPHLCAIEKGSRSEGEQALQAGP
jgi:SUKH-4 immunity protein